MKEWKLLTKRDYLKRPTKIEIVEFYQTPDGKPVTEVYHHKPDRNRPCDYCGQKLFPKRNSIGFEFFWDNDPMEIICEDCYHELKG